MSARFALEVREDVFPDQVRRPRAGGIQEEVMVMTRLYLALGIVGFGIPLALAPWTLRHPDNLLFVLDPAETLELTFGNYASAAFTADLIWVFAVFCSWVILESRSRGIERSWLFILLAFLFGVSGPFPLFLWWRERQLATRARERRTSAAW